MTFVDLLRKGLHLLRKHAEEPELREWSALVEQTLQDHRPVIPCAYGREEARYWLMGTKTAVCPDHAAGLKSHNKVRIQPHEHIAPFGADEGLSLCLMLRSWAEETGHRDGVHAAEEVMLNVLEVAGGNLDYNATWQAWRFLWFQRINFRYHEEAMKEAEALGLAIRLDLVQLE